MKYSEVMNIKLPARLKEQAEEKAKEREMTLSSYVRDLIVKDIRGN